MSEIKIHRGLRHPNICSFKHFFDDKDHIYMILEMCHNETMHELLVRRKRLTELEI
jgi:serine/threonine protein kinase